MAQYAITDTEIFQISKIDGTVYDIYLYLPKVEEEFIPKKGYPITYLLDGNATFPIATTYAKLGAVAPKKGIRPVPQIVVGITAHDNSPFSKQRMYDFTPFAIPEQMPEKFSKMQIVPEQTGGIESFIDFIEQQLKPLIEEKYHINRDNQTIVGHSLGGLFATYVLMNHRNLYQHYVIGSPSLWWNGGELLEQSTDFASGKETVKILVGSKEPKFMQERSRKLSENIESKVSKMIFKLCDDKNHLDMIFETIFQIYKN